MLISRLFLYFALDKNVFVISGRAPGNSKRRRKEIALWLQRRVWDKSKYDIFDQNGWLSVSNDVFDSMFELGFHKLKRTL